MIKKIHLITWSIFFFGTVTLVSAQEEQVTSDKENTDEVAAKLNNPTSAIGSLNFLFDYKTYQGDLPGADEQNAWSLTFQPSLPKPIGSKGLNLLIRPAIPLIFSQPVYNGVDGFNSSGVQLGNIGFDLALGTTLKSGLMVLGGLVGTLPTATSADIRAQWAFGPELLIGYLSKKLIIGALLSQQWDVENDPERKTNLFGGQYFVFVPIGKGRSIGAAPLYSYNWETKELSFPVGIGYSAVTLFGDMPFKYGLQIFYNVVTPDPLGQVWQIRLQLTPVIKLPWK
jgi:hypothetical protein